MTEQKKIIAIITSNPEDAKLYESFFTDEGYTAVGTLLTNGKDDEANIQRLLTEHNPETVLFNIGLPYTRQWQLLQSVRAQEGAARRAYAVTSLGKRELVSAFGEEAEKVVDPTTEDLEFLLQLIKKEEAEAQREKDGPRIRRERG